MNNVRPSGNRSRKMRLRRGFLLVCWLALAGVLIARAAEVQVVERVAWMEDALRQHQKSKVVPASRGRILDRNGGELAMSHWRATVAVAPNEVGDRAQVEAALVENLGVRPPTAMRVSESTRGWHVVPGRYSMTQVEGLQAMRGVYVEGELRRLYPREGLARSLLGIVQEGVGTEGVEQSMDSVLAGQAGREIVARDNRGREIPGQVVMMQPPVPGRDVVLTIDQDLQAIAEEMLAIAIDSTGARGGDLVITDPATGEILAMTSMADGAGSTLSAVNTTYEPGATIKPFTTAALLRHGLASLNDSVDTGVGSWSVNGRRITDIDGGGGWLTLHEVVRQSSNVGIAMFAGLMTEGQQYTSLRDFGFGTPTGVALPGEASGILRRPEHWSGLSSQSLAYGYEISVTSLQMAMAFGALANGGWLMEPRLIREVRDNDGQPVRFGWPRAVRRAVPERVTAALTPVLVDVVENGTGTRARMSSFLVAGKSGTARATGEGGHYERGAYYASFGAYFPADDPQLLIFVKLDRPDGTYYGGATAAPVTRATLETLLSARQSPIDRRALARVQRRAEPPPPSAPLVRFAVATAEPEAGVWPRAEDPVADHAGTMTIPVLDGASVRVALRRLHKMGLRVLLEGAGTVRATVPGAGDGVAAGDTVRVLAAPGEPPPRPGSGETPGRQGATGG